MKYNIMFTFVQIWSIRDNDVLASLVATELRADLLILLSDVEGLYSAPPGDPGSRLLHTYHPAQLNKIKFYGQSRVGKQCTYMCIHTLAHMLGRCTHSYVSSTLLIFIIIILHALCVVI